MTENPLELADSYDSLTDVPADHLALYVERDGKAVLDVSQVKSQDDFDRYGKALKARLDDAKRKNQGGPSGVTRDEVEEIFTSAAAKLLNGKRDPGKGGGNGDDSELATRVHDLERELSATKEKLDKANTDRESAQSQATTTTIKNALTGAAVKSGVRSEAVDSLVSLVEKSFEISGEGGVVTKIEGGTVEGVTPNTKPGDFFTAIKRADNYSYFWPASKGGGSQPGDRGKGGGDDKNPWSAKGWNMTRQGELVRENRANAEDLAKQAGSHIGAVKPPK